MSSKQQYQPSLCYKAGRMHHSDMLRCNSGGDGWSRPLLRQTTGSERIDRLYSDSVQVCVCVLLCVPFFGYPIHVHI